MRKILLVLTLVAGVLVAPVLAAAPASARCAAPGSQVFHVLQNASFTYYPTDIKSDWAMSRKDGTISYSTSDTMEANASMTGTVQAEAGVIFAETSRNVWKLDKAPA